MQQIQTQYATAFRAMGCQVQIWLETYEDGESILQQMPAWFEDVESVFSRFRPESELSQLNQRSGQNVAVSALLFDLVQQAIHISRKTEGFFSPLVLPALVAVGYDRTFEEVQGMEHSGERPPHTPIPGKIVIDENSSTIRIPESSGMDLGGLVKGWMAQHVARYLSVYGSCLVDVGGDLVARSHPESAVGWLVNVDEPGHNGASLLTIQLHDEAVATSGVDHRRWGENHHIIDPRTGLPAQTDVVTATVIHPDATLAEAFAKALVIRGCEDGLEWLSQQPAGAGLVICTDGAVRSTQSFLSYIVQG